MPGDFLAAVLADTQFKITHMYYVKAWPKFVGGSKKAIRELCLFSIKGIPVSLMEKLNGHTIQVLLL